MHLILNSSALGIQNPTRFSTVNLLMFKVFETFSDIFNDPNLVFPIYVAK